MYTIYFTISLFLFTPLHGPLRAFAAYSSYNIKDLEILESENNFQEFIKHAKDIRPIDRNQQWKEMLLNMASKMVDDLLSKSRSEKSHLKQIESLLEWATLRNDQVFTSKRNDYALFYLKKCLSANAKNKECLKSLTDIWHNGHHSFAKDDLGVQIIELLNSFKIESIPKWDFIKDSVKGPLSQMICRKKIVHTVILKEMVKIIEKYDKEVTRENKLEKLAHHLCWDILIPGLKKSLYHGPRRAQEAIYTLLKSYSKISIPEENIFLTKFILAGPYNGPVFNRAWNRLQLLGKSFKARESVLKNLKQSNTLPDQLFKFSSLKRNTIIIDHINRNMPEYLDFYARTCISYYGGSKIFTKGNPTIYCRNLFTTIKENPLKKYWIDPGTLRKFQSLKL